MLSHPFITIGIPTWNRCGYLKKNIDSLVHQITKNNLHELVEIVISDNGSTDGTKFTCEDLSNQYSFIKYHRHQQNRGANANFQFVIEAANGKYVWLLGDDDLVVDDIITKVIQDIEQNQPDVVVGPAIFDHTKEKATHQKFQEIVLTNREVLTREDVIALAGKISGLIFKKSSVMPVISIAEPVIIKTKTPWPHLAWLILLLNDADKKILILPYGINQLVAAHWHNLLFTGETLLIILFIDYQSLLLALKSYLDPLLFKKLLDRSVSTRQSSLLKCVLYGTYLDGYFKLFSLASESYVKIVGFKNKLNYLLFLLFPLAIPKAVRKLIYYSVKQWWPKLHLTIARIHEAKEILISQLSNDRRQYSENEL